MQLDHNTILITGGGSGIGLALAQAFAGRSGNTVIVCGRSREKLEAACRATPSLIPFPCDIADDHEQERLVATLTARFPRLNVLINNAGIQNTLDFTDRGSHTRAIDEEVAIDFLAPAKLTDRILPHLLSQPSAAIVNVTSALAVVPKPSTPIYAASKAALRGFTKALRYQLEDSSVKVFEIVPALVDTAMTRGRGRGKISPEALAREALAGIAADRFEIRIGKTKLLLALNRLWPSLAERIIRSG